MDILTSNQTTSNNSNTIELQESKDKWKSSRQGFLDKIVETTTTQTRLMLSEQDDIGNPAQLCEVLSKLRLEYTKIIAQEKEEHDKIIQKYNTQVANNKRWAVQLVADLSNLLHKTDINMGKTTKNKIKIRRHINRVKKNGKRESRCWRNYHPRMYPLKEKEWWEDIWKYNGETKTAEELCGKLTPIISGLRGRL